MVNIEKTIDMILKGQIKIAQPKLVAQQEPNGREEQ